MLNEIKRHRALVGYLILCAGMIFAITIASLAVNRVADQSNDTRCSIVGLAVQLTENSARNAQATLASHSASAEQKQAATKNLTDITDLLNTTTNALGHPHGAACVIPSPVP